MYNYEIRYSYTKEKVLDFESDQPIPRQEWVDRLRLKHPDSSLKIIKFKETLVDQSALSLDLFGADLSKGLHPFKIRDETYPEWRYFSNARIKIFRSDDFNEVFVRVYQSEDEDSIVESFSLSYTDPASCLVHYADRDEFYVDFMLGIVKDEGITQEQLTKLLEKMSD